MVRNNDFKSSKTSVGMWYHMTSQSNSSPVQCFSLGMFISLADLKWGQSHNTATTTTTTTTSNNSLWWRQKRQLICPVFAETKGIHWCDLMTYDYEVQPEKDAICPDGTMVAQMPWRNLI